MPRRSTAAVASVLLTGAAVGPLAVGFAGLSAPPALGRAQAASAAVARQAAELGEAAPEGRAPEPFRIASAVVSMLAALVVALAPVAEAQAARTGGRIGSSAPSKREQRAPPTARTAEPSVINRTTVINKTTVVAPPPSPPPVIVAPPPTVMMAAPVIVAPPPPTLGDVIVGVAVSSAINSTIPRGPSVNDRIMENQMRQDERQLDKQSNQIEDLKREIAEMKK